MTAIIRSMGAFVQQTSRMANSIARTPSITDLARKALSTAALGSTPPSGTVSISEFEHLKQKVATIEKRLADLELDKDQPCAWDCYFPPDDDDKIMELTEESRKFPKIDPKDIKLNFIKIQS